MNVRFYLEKAVRATEALAAHLGLGGEVCRELGGTLELRDVFTRHYREQLLGAPLAVLGGVLAVRGDGLRVYHELLNTERGERAAIFVHEVALRERSSRSPLPLPEPAVKSAGDARVAWPEHGRPRTLDLDQPPPPLSLEEARRRDLAMREERTVRPEECDEAGFFVAARYQDLVWGGNPIVRRAGGWPLFELEGGGRMGWATLENRASLLELPRTGTRVQSFGAEVALVGKTSLRHQWVFDLDRKALLCTSSILNLAFDLETRRAIEIPGEVRRRLEALYHPDLR